MSAARALEWAAADPSGANRGAGGPADSGLVSFTIEHIAAPEAVSALADQNFQLRSLEDPLCLRACTHVFSTDAEIDQLLQAIAQL